MAKEEITLKIKTVQDAIKITGRPDVPEFENLPEDLREYFKAQYSAVVTVEALNQGTKMDWNDPNQKKWMPWFRKSGGGFVFDDTRCRYTGAFAGAGSRLCLKSDELATYFGEQFTDVCSDIISK